MGLTFINFKSMISEIAINMIRCSFESFGELGLWMKLVI